MKKQLLLGLVSGLVIVAGTTTYVMANSSVEPTNPISHTSPVAINTNGQVKAANTVSTPAPVPAPTTNTTTEPSTDPQPPTPQSQITGYTTECRDTGQVVYEVSVTGQNGYVHTYDAYKVAHYDDGTTADVAQGTTVGRCDHEGNFNPPSGPQSITVY